MLNEERLKALGVDTTIARQHVDEIIKLLKPNTDTIDYTYSIETVREYIENEDELIDFLSDQECVEVLRRVNKWNAFPSYEAFIYAIEAVRSDRK